ncbi:Bor/Iss family lipoprotein [Psychrobacter sp. JCM 18900]|uniref:Bor/Iss family lipoprotein n=1 Tax=Psychrobacter sp. JCM 18900 TaxID=1298608 RepID=UPI00351C05E1
MRPKIICCLHQRRQVLRYNRTLKRCRRFFVSGLGQEKEIDAAAVCQGQQNVASIQTKSNFINIVLGTISNGIYTPRQISVYCK